MSLQFLEGTDGRKMSKSWGNAIWIADAPNEMYGKVMSLKDELIVQYFTLGTKSPLSEVKEFENRLNSGENPLNIKKELAFSIVRELHSVKDAEKAAEFFKLTFQKRKVPDNIEEFIPKSINIADVMTEIKFVSSKSEARRLISQGGVEYSGKKVNDFNFILTEPGLLKVGTRRFAKIKIS